MKRFYTIILGVATGISLSACASVNEPIAPEFGNSTEQNFHAMVDDPRPAEGDPTTDARVVDSAMDRYRTGSVEEPESAGTFRADGGGG